MVRPAYFKLIEECVSQIVLHKSGCDPDFRATKRFNIDVEPLIEQLVERGRLEDAASIGASMGMTAGLEAAITEKQETEAKLAHAEMRIKQLEEAVKNGGGAPGPLANGIQAVASIIRPGGGPPPPPPPPGGAGLPPPPPPPPGMGGPPPPHPPPGVGGPPPPPPPGPGGPPPPPPPGGAPPPPPPFGAPKPPGAPGPPGPPGPPAAPAAVDVLAKLGMKRKKKWTVEGQIKRTNWKAVPLTKLTEKAFWTNVDEEQLASQSLIEEIQNKFSSRPPAKKSIDDGNGNASGKKKSKELKVLDAKAAQNLSVVLGGALKHISYKDVRKIILRCDTSVLTENLLQSLIQYLPTPDQLNKLKEHSDEYDNLAEAEQFAISLADIKRLVPRLKSLKFQLHFPELVQDCKPDIVAATEACQEVRRSQKFGKILELILLMGNIMNTGSRNEQSLGFDISYLPKLSNTKDRDNKSTLLHFLVETIEKSHPKLLNFYEELIHLDKASRVSLESVQKTLKQMDSAIKNLETDLKNSARTVQDKDDKFEECMGTFAKDARDQYSILQAMGTKMETLYADLAEYLVFDKQKYTLEEFFSDIKTFKDGFKHAYDSILKERESEAKLVRAREEREKAERERAERE